MHIRDDPYAGMRPEEFAGEIGRFDHQLAALKTFLASLKSSITSLREPNPSDYSRWPVRALGYSLDTLYDQADHWKAPTRQGEYCPDLPETSPLGLQLILQAREQEWKTLTAELESLKTLLDHACRVADSENPKDKTPGEVALLSKAVIKLVIIAEYGRRACLDLYPLPTAEEIRQGFKETFLG